MWNERGWYDRPIEDNIWKEDGMSDRLSRYRTPAMKKCNECCEGRVEPTTYAEKWDCQRDEWISPEVPEKDFQNDGSLHYSRYGKDIDSADPDTWCTEYEEFPRGKRESRELGEGIPTMNWTQEDDDSTDDKYELLEAVLNEAYEQAARSKGVERHADGQPYEEQPVMWIERYFKSSYSLTLLFMCHFFKCVFCFCFFI